MEEVTKINHIKFSHWYPKLDNAKQAVLVTVTKVDNLENQHPAFLSYDTYFYDNAAPDLGEGGYYELDIKKPHLILLFFVDQPVLANKLSNIPNPAFFFTTIRPYNKQKEEYYKNLIGQEFEIIINTETKIEQKGR